MNKLVLYNSSVQNDIVLLNSFNNTCVLKNANDFESIDKLVETVDISSISYLALIYHSTNGDFKIPFFPGSVLSETINGLPYYSNKYTNYTFFSDELIDLIKKFPQGITLDLLTCNLNNESFINEADKIQTDLNINIRYSLDQTGNNPEGNWVLESDNVNVKDLYFTNQIDLWSDTLAASWQTTGTSQNWFPLAISGDGSKIFAGILPGIIYRSTDGSNWSVFNNSSKYWSGLACSNDGSKLVAVAQTSGGNIGGVYLYSDISSFNDPSGWRSVSEAGYYQSVVCSSNRNIIAVNGGPAYAATYPIKISMDSGLTWSSTPFNCDVRNMAMSADGYKIIAPSLMGLGIYIGTYNGTSWSWVNRGSALDYISVSADSTCTNICVGVSLGKLYISSDGGNNWSQIGVNGYWRSLTSSADGSRVYLARQYDGSIPGELFESLDYGNTWTPLGAANLSWVNIRTSQNGYITFAAPFGGQIVKRDTTPPNAPTNIYAVAGNSNAAISWTAPTNNGGSAITSYTITSTPGNITKTTSSTYDIITGLTNGVSYTFTVYATNSGGNSTSSVSSNSIVPNSNLYLYFDSTIPASYSGSGTTWTSIPNNTYLNLQLNNTTYSNGIVFNGTNSYAGKAGYLTPGNIPPTFPSSPLTIIYWLNTNSTNPQALFTLNRTSDNITNQLYITTTFTFDHGNSTFGFNTDYNSTYNFSVPTNKVTQFVFKRNGRSGIFYTNGVSRQDISNSGEDVTYGSSHLYVGVNYRDINDPIYNYYFNGTIYAIKAYSSALSDSEITTEYNNGITPSAPFNAIGTVSGNTATLNWSASLFKGYGQTPKYLIYDETTNTLLKTITDNSTSTTVTIDSSNNLYIVASNTVNSVNYNSSIVYFTVSYSTPSAPTSLNASSVSSTGLTVSWSSPSNNGGSNILYYNIYKSTDASSYTIDSSSATISKAITGLSVNTTYYFKISAVNSQGEGVLSSVLTQATSNIVPNVPTDLSASSISSTSLTVSWNAPTNNGNSNILYYNIYKSTDSSSYTIDSSSAIVSKAITGLSVNTTYYFKVSAVNSQGEGGLSTTLTQATSNIVPNIPTDLSASNISESGLDLSWTAPSSNGGSNILHYNIYKSTDNITFNFDSSSNTTSKSITGLSVNNTYYFKVKAVNIAGEGNFSTGVTVPYSLIQAPVITSILAGNQSATVIFDQSNNTGYAVTQYRYTINNGSSYVYRLANIISSPWFIPDLSNSIQYSIKISAKTQIGWGPNSNSLSVTPVDNRTTEIKVAIADISTNTISNLGTQILTDISSGIFEEKVQIINSVIQDISNQPLEIKVSTLLVAAMNLLSTDNELKSNINDVLIECGVSKNTPFDITNPIIINQILDVSSFKAQDWAPTTLSTIVPQGNNLTIDLDNPDSLLLFVPGETYTVNALYQGNLSTNSYSIVYNRSDNTRYLTIDGTTTKNIGDTILFNFPTTQSNFKINMLAGVGGKQLNVPSGAGDPHIYPIIGNSYFLPHNEKCYLLYDNQKEDRVIVTAKCWFLPQHIKNNSKFKNHFMNDTTFFKYINIYHNGENLTIDMETLKPVKYTNMNDLNSFKLEFINNTTSIQLSNYIEDKFVFKNYYNSLKVKKYNIDFNGKSRIIKLNNGYEFKLSLDLNCADHRNEIKLINVNYSNAIGALISEKYIKVVEIFQPSS